MSNEITIDFTDLDSIAAAVGSGITTIELVADYLGLELSDSEGYLVLEASPWVADDGHCEISFPDCGTAAEAAKKYIDDGDWGDDRSSTAWITASAWKWGLDSDGRKVHVFEESHTVTIEADEPECVDGGEHVWESPYSILGGLKENPGVWGNGGGVIVKEVCMCCGSVKTTDTWAQNSATGEQGLTSVEYSGGEYADEVRSRQIAKAKEALDTDTDQGESSDDRGGFDFIWENSDGEIVGADDDDLAEYGIALYRDEDAEPIKGTELEADEA
jgi:hypothetical protein